MTSASGSIGGTTFSHNRGGLYTRARRVPVNPRTAPQEAMRNILASLQAAYPLLTSTQRSEWAVFAANVTVPNRLGMPIKLTAQQWFVKFNSSRSQGSLTVIDEGPVTYALATLTPPVPTITAAGTTVSVVFTPADVWANQDGGGLLVYASRPQNSTKNFFVGPYQFSGIILGDGTTPPTSPAIITLPFASGPTGSKQFFKFTSTLGDGRSSTPFRVVAQV
jgi:hypothetical protein